ncbi:MAG: polysaccharide deacetylase, partial [Proteobacteria bacterium]
MRLKTALSSLIGRHAVVRPARLAGDRALASVAFDDFPQNAWIEGGPVLARHGVRATYYTAGSFCGRTVDGTQFYDADDLTALSAAGHEIGCHGFGHRPVPEMSAGELAQDVDRNADFLRPFLNGGTADSYAFPYGRVSRTAKHFLSPRFSSLRGTHEGPNKGRVDLAQLNVVSLETRLWNEAALDAAIQRAARDASWLIFYTHDVCDNPGPY